MAHISKRWHRRFIIITITGIFLSISLILILNTFRDNIVFFFSPTELLSNPLKKDKTIRLGGVVKENSVQINKTNNSLKFILTDFENEIQVYYKGTIPILFKEGSGTVALGKLQGEIFHATEVLAKHDENYMPKEVADSLKNRFKKSVF